jgi:hypothetical protein
MVLRNGYVIARSASGRATAMHKMRDGQNALTDCGNDTSPWSRIYLTAEEARPMLPIMCGNCKPVRATREEKVAA